jgi:hypothetical protein
MRSRRLPLFTAQSAGEPGTLPRAARLGRLPLQLPAHFLIAVMRLV